MGQETADTVGGLCAQSSRGERTFWMQRQDAKNPRSNASTQMETKV
jgi:hypothetical protein